MKYFVLFFPPGCVCDCCNADFGNESISPFALTIPTIKIQSFLIYMKHGRNLDWYMRDLKRNVEPANANPQVDSCFGLFGPRQLV